MFLNKNYVLSNELVQKMDINIANISMLAKKYREYSNYGAIIKMNNTSFINSRDQTLPKNIKDGLNMHKCTDMSDKLLCGWLKSEYELTGDDLVNTNIIIDKITVSKKDFYVFSPEFVGKMRNKMGYVLGKGEAIYCYNTNKIDGYTKIDDSRYFAWY
jgi:hypothetical protein